MAEFQRPASEAEFAENFAQIKPAMNSTEAYYESSRCLFCYDAPCTQACPTSIDIPLFIRQINSGNVVGAARTIYASNYFGRACGQVCPTDVLCEGACVYTHQDIKPIEIGRLQAFATQQAIEKDIGLFHRAQENGRSIAVIGAGPAGICCACELRRTGFAVDIFEAKGRPSGLAVHGIAPYKITNEAVLEEMDYLSRQFGFKVHYNSPVIGKPDLERLKRDYDAVFIGIGLGTTADIRIPGEDLASCVGAVEFIEQLRLNHHKTTVGKRVIVLGGGNTAMDAASESARMGAESVTLCYRRSKEQMRAYGFEYDLAKSVGVNALFNVIPTEIVGQGDVEGVKFVRTQSEENKIAVIPDSEFIEPADMVIKATGQVKLGGILSQIEGLQTDDSGCIVVNAKGQTTNPRYFAGGDAANGGREVVDAAAEGKRAADGIREFLAA
jgi:glutamate synthase (NADPH/NADH) small chain